METEVSPQQHLLNIDPFDLKAMEDEQEERGLQASQLSIFLPSVFKEAGWKSSWLLAVTFWKVLPP